MPNRLKLVAASVLSVAATGAIAQAAPDSHCKPLRPLERRILEKAGQDTDMVALRQFVVQMRMIHELDATEVAGWVDSLRAREACSKASAAAGRQGVAEETKR
jgi:hypothetical protein